MATPNSNRAHEKAKRRAVQRERKRKPRMKVSGKEVLKLQDIIRRKGKS